MVTERTRVKARLKCRYISRGRGAVIPKLLAANEGLNPGCLEMSSVGREQWKGRVILPIPTPILLSSNSNHEHLLILCGG